MKKKLPVILGTLLLLMAVSYLNMGLYSIPPIGAVPEGATFLLWRAGDQPFFDSPDGACLRRMGGVSLLCRGLAMSQRDIAGNRLMRLPYFDSAYLWSTGGQAPGRGR